MFINFQIQGPWTYVVFFLLAPSLLWAQGKELVPPVSRSYAIVNAQIVQAPGKKIEGGTVVFKNGLIVAVGKNIPIPPEAIRIQADSLSVYAGFVDGLSHIGVTELSDAPARDQVKDPGNPAPDKAGITPQMDVRLSINPWATSIMDIRNVGFTTAHVVPYGVFLPGTGAILQLSGELPDHMDLSGPYSIYSEFTWKRGVYPSTVMGVMSKWRELYRQAIQAKNYASVYASNRTGLERPVSDHILESFYPVIDRKRPVYFKAESVLDVQRALVLQADLGFVLALGDIKEGWDVIDKLKSSGAHVFLSLDLPEEIKEEKKSEAPKSSNTLEEEALLRRKVEFIAKRDSQAAFFYKSGIRFGFSAMSVKPANIKANLVRMIKAGLPEEEALAALTVRPAQILGLGDRMGTIDPGKIANLVISRKPYFDEKSEVRFVVVDGQVFETPPMVKGKGNEGVNIEGTWSFVTETPQGKTENKVVFKTVDKKIQGSLSGSQLSQAVELSEIILDGSRLTFTFALTLNNVTETVSYEGKIEGDTFTGQVNIGKSGTFPVKGKKTLIEN